MQTAAQSLPLNAACADRAHSLPRRAQSQSGGVS
ncbi:Uncharacterised protein [Vibrio cholerae]|nr:Uncharacterised protein [Vibrio cholerae]